MVQHWCGNWMSKHLLSILSVPSVKGKLKIALEKF